MTVGGRCGKRLFYTIESFKHSKGLRELSNEHRRDRLVAMPPVLHRLLSMQPHPSHSHLLLFPNQQDQLKLLLLLLHQKFHSPVSVVFSVGVNSILHAIASNIRINGQATGKLVPAECPWCD
jgi:hypothetical protein